MKCIDYWPGKIQPEKLAAYKEMIEEGQIRKHHVVFNQRSGSTLVEYYAIAPHEWILETMKKKGEAAWQSTQNRASSASSSTNVPTG